MQLYLALSESILKPVQNGQKEGIKNKIYLLLVEKETG